MNIKFVDFEIAVDTFDIQSVLDALTEQRTDDNYIELIQNIYQKAITIIRLHTDNKVINVKKGVRQGDTMSLKLFNAVLGKVFKSLDWEKVGIKINGDNLSHLGFVDDITAFSEKPNEIHINK